MTTRIRLETSLRRGIDNLQGLPLSKSDIYSLSIITQSHPNARLRTKPTTRYNCHGMVFASRRTQVFKSTDIRNIIADDGYVRIQNARDAIPGDIVLYVDGSGDVNHSGIVLESGQNLIAPIVLSKWGLHGEFIHAVHDVPSYGPKYEYYRCNP